MTATAIEPLRLFIPITKIDSAKRIVYGTLTQAVADRSGEIIDYPSTKAAYQKWSDEQSAATKGKSKGNLRAMHGNVAAGKFTDIVFDDENESIQGAAYVSDDNEWKKCEDGTYSGFSHGGSYAKRWTDPDNPKLKRYTPVLAEVSLVDAPCVPTATFEYIKADGSTELRKFNHITQEDNMTATETLSSTAAADAKDTVEKSAAASVEVTTTEADTTVAKAADEDAKPVLTKEGKPVKPENEPVQKWLAKDGSQHDRKDEARKRNLEIETEEKIAPSLAKMEEALSKATSDDTDKDSPKKESEPEAKDEPKDAAAEKKVGSPIVKVTEPSVKEVTQNQPVSELKKSLYGIGCLASILGAIDDFMTSAEWERAIEGDNSTIPETIQAWLKTGADILKAYVEEETSELFDGDDVEVMAMAAKMTGAQCDAIVKFGKSEKAKVLSKAGARHSATDKDALMAVHKSATDHLETIEKCFKAAGVMDDASDDDKTTQKMSKLLSTLNDTLAKNDALTSIITKSSALMEKTASVVDALVDDKKQLALRIDHLEKQPAVAKGNVRAIAKTQDTGTGDGETAAEQFEAGLAKMTPDQKAIALMKMSLQNPIR